ncbi:MAG: response regulator transcription factor [Candidatus Aminicenantes bacterium]|jgi:DNA-binding NarL/FixJ family response regulator
MIKVLIADDHPVVREGLKKIFEKDPIIKVVAEANNGEELLKKISKNPCDVVLMDLSMPGRSWLDVIKEIKDLRANLPVLIVSMHKEEEYIVRALKSGASGYLTKDSLSDELLTAVKKVVRGGRYVTAAIAEKLIDLLDDDKEQPLHKTLSDREYQVFTMIARGKKTQEIADELFLSTNTISTYRARILEKMNLKNTAEIIHYALNHKLLD